TLPTKGAIEERSLFFKAPIIPSTSGWMTSFKPSNRRYASWVETPTSGLHRRIKQSGRGKRAERLVPIPWAKEVPPRKQKGTSAPSLAPRSSRDSDDIRVYKWLSAKSTAAASALPPANPA